MKSTANSSSCSTSVPAAPSKSAESSKPRIFRSINPSASAKSWKTPSANSGPLTDAAVRRLFERIIDEARSAERQAMHLGDVVDKDEKL